MKRILLFAFALMIIVAACKKQQKNPDIVVTASFPQITLAVKYYSIPVGGLRPTPQVTAYDTFYKKSVPVTKIDSAVNTFVAGYYPAYLTATSQYGYVSYDTYYVAVTPADPALDLTGNYSDLSDTSIKTNVVKLATGLFITSNYAATTDTGTVVAAPAPMSEFFVITGASTIAFADGTTGTLSLLPVVGDTSFSYKSSGAGAVTFSK